MSLSKKYYIGLNIRIISLNIMESEKFLFGNWVEFDAGK